MFNGVLDEVIQNDETILNNKIRQEHRLCNKHNQLKRYKYFCKSRQPNDLFLEDPDELSELSITNGENPIVSGVTLRHVTLFPVVFWISAILPLPLFVKLETAVPLPLALTVLPILCT